MELKELEDMFAYHETDASQRQRLESIREAGLQFAKVVFDCAPPSADRTAAIRKVREAMWTANSAIAREP